MKRIIGCLLFSLLASALPAEEAAAPQSPELAQISPADMAFFETKVRPVFVEHCFKCHGAGKHKGNFQLDSRAHLLAGGDSGPAIIPGNSAESLLIQAINYDGYEMPPGQKMSAEKIADLTKWVQMGAPWPGAQGEEIAAVRKEAGISDEDRSWWAFQPIVSPPIPQLKQSAPPDNPIDAFVLATLEEHQLTPNPAADARTLVRRAFFDLVGLPPAPEEAHAWEAALQNDGTAINQVAWARLIDDLLARPEYGERWGRHWLDIVRFAQTNGYERDNEKKYAWRYRDYVVQAFNSDKPYDRFLVEQLAGDELPDADQDSRIATGFYRLGLWDDEPDDMQQAEFDDLDDIVVTSSAAFLGLTIGCARCHDHKFDPILHRDYYSLVAFFRNIRKFSNADDSPENSGLLPISSPEKLAAALEERQQRWAELDAKIAVAKDDGEKKKLENQRKSGTLKGLDWAMAVRENGPTVKETHVLIRGNAQTPGDVVQPVFPQVLGGGQPEIVPPARDDQFQTSGRRLALAQWLVGLDHPLTARVMANRVWHYHFGRGIVSTTSDFGRVGAPPSHPELLDWLADDFRARGWSVKQLHRRIMLSQTYQRSSAHRNERANEVDPGNTLLWRQNLRRLEAEAIRDSLLAVSGTLNSEMGGRGFFPLVGAEVLSGGTIPGVGWETSSTSQRNRRSLYTFIKRSLVSPQLDTFDYANTSLPLTERPTTTVAPQALALLNDTFMQQQAAAFARRIERESGTGMDARVTRAFELALNRVPTPVEMELAKNFITQQRAEFAELRSRIVFRPIVPVAMHPSYLKQLTDQDFMDGPESDWTPLRGQWNASGTLDPQQGPVSLWKGALFTDARIASSITLGNASELAGLFLRANEAGAFVTGYEILLDARNSQLAVIRHDGAPHPLGQVPAEIPTGVPLSIIGTIDGGHVTVRLQLPGDRVAVVDTIDPDPLMSPGSLGVRTWGAAVTLDGLELTTDHTQLDVATAEVVPLQNREERAPWTEFDGNWSVTGEGSIQPLKPSSGGKLIWNDVEFSDGIVEADIRVHGTGDAGIVIRVGNPHSGVDALTAYNINFSKTHLRLGKHQDNWRALVSIPYSFSAEHWTHVRAELTGARIRIYVDDQVEPLIDFTDPQPLPPGRVGFRTFRCPVEYRNVTVKDARTIRAPDVQSIRPEQAARFFVTGTKPDECEHQAFQAFCLLVLNLNEMIYVE